MNIEHISVSRAQCFIDCPFSYKCRYHLKLQSPGPEAPWFAYGKTVHRICELYVEGKAEKSVNEVANEVLSGKIPIEEKFGKKVYAPHLSEEYKNRLPEHLRSLERITKLLGTSGHTEYVFSYDLMPPNNIILTGVIDRLIEKNNKYWIIDYKTTKKDGQWRKTPQSIIGDIQLRCYARVVQKTFNVPAENIQAALFYLEGKGGENLIGARFDQKSLLDVEKYLLKIYQQIKAMEANDARGIVSFRCRFCDWKKMCPYYKGK
jgi:ATP-dependent helicase/DNAse subunit B